MKNIAKAVLNFVLPPCCVVCGRLGIQVCEVCLNELVPVGSRHCRVCGIPFLGAGGSHPCSRCLAGKAVYDRHRAVFRFNEPVKRLMHALKYNHQFWVSEFFTPYFKSLAGEFAGVDLIFPVPLHKSRLKRRGFNQSQVLAALWGRILNKEVCASNLVRVKNTPSQTGLRRSERRKNLRQAFFLTDKEVVRGKTLLVVDDVHTTGVTLNEAARVLKAAGAARVMATTAAIVA